MPSWLSDSVPGDAPGDGASARAASAAATAMAPAIPTLAATTATTPRTRSRVPESARDERDDLQVWVQVSWNSHRAPLPRHRHIACVAVTEVAPVSSTMRSSCAATIAHTSVDPA